MSQIISIVEKIGYQNLGLILILVSIFVDITPQVKFNPWKFIFGKIGKYINHSIETELAGFKTDVYKKIDTLRAEQRAEFDQIKHEQEIQAETLQGLIRDLNYKEICRLRWEITDFEASIARGNKHPREQYRHIIDEAEKFIRMASEESDNGLLIDNEEILKIKESLKHIQEHYDANQSIDAAAFMI